MLLTIGIPVYNGAAFIGKTIESVLNLKVDWSQVEVIVSDNASTDHTADLVGKYPAVQLYRHNENVGFDGNVDRLFQYAKGKYVWIMGADDLIIYDNIDEILAVAKQGVAGVIHVGKSDYSQPSLVENAETFFRRTNLSSGFVSINIIKKTSWQSIDRTPLLKSAWIHFGMVLQLAKKEPSFIASKNYVEEQELMTDKSWNNSGAGILVSLKLVEILCNMEAWGYSKDFIKEAKMVVKGAYPRELVRARIGGLKTDRRLLLRFIRLYKEFVSFWLVDLWVLIIPAFLFKWCFSIYNSFKK